MAVHDRDRGNVSLDYLANARESLCALGGVCVRPGHPIALKVVDNAESDMLQRNVYHMMQVRQGEGMYLSVL